MHKYHQDGTLPKQGEIFVFGSNLAGVHGAGAALAARQHFGAELGVGIGMTGNSYAIPSKDQYIQTLPLEIVVGYIHDFIAHAWANYTKHNYFVTRIGCGLAGFEDADIAPHFKQATPNVYLPEPWRKYIETKKK